METLPVSKETLRQKRSRFSKDMAGLILWWISQGYEVTVNEVLRSKAEAEQNAKDGDGIKNSLHLIGLAVDLNLFKDGKYLSKNLDHKPGGVYWESLGTDYRWGGRFGDGNHYSIEHEGIK